MDNDSALVVFSGGLDSTFCLFWALERFKKVSTICFDYGQRNIVETEQRRIILDKIPDTLPCQFKGRLDKNLLVSTDFFHNVTSGLMEGDSDINGVNERGQNKAFVPGRNIMFLNMAAIIGYNHNIPNLISGVRQTYNPGYPDSKDDTIKSLQVTLNLAMDYQFVIHTPLMHTGKEHIWDYASENWDYDVLGILTDDTHSCYNNDRTLKHDWGYGCGNCPACNARKEGYESAW